MSRDHCLVQSNITAATPACGAAANEPPSDEGHCKAAWARTTCIKDRLAQSCQTDARDLEEFYFGAQFRREITVRLLDLHLDLQGSLGAVGLRSDFGNVAFI